MTVTISESRMIDPTIVVALITALVAFLGVLLDRHRVALERRRVSAAEALTDALLWLEVPYRISRRTSDNPGDLNRLVEHMHRLQERHVYHAAWLELEIPSAVEPYGDLLRAVKAQTLDAAQAAWESPPKTSGSQMNIGVLYKSDVANQRTAYIEAVRRAVRLRSFG